MPGRLAIAMQRLVLRLGETRMRPALVLAFRALARAVGSYLLRGEPGGAIYLGGSFAQGDPLVGVSDVDIAIVVGGDGDAPGAARQRVRARWATLRRRAPALAEVVHVAIHDDAGLREAVRGPTLIYGLDRPPDSAYFGPALSGGAVGLLEGGLYGPLARWRRVAGPERRPGSSPQDDQGRRLASWLALQSWWRWTFGACTMPPTHRRVFLCAKMVIEPARIWLWLTRAERFDGRTAVIDRAIEALPEHESALRAARALMSRLPGSPDPPLAATLPTLTAISSRIADRIVADLEHAGTTSVRLVGIDGELALPADAPAPGRLLPLADWKARTVPGLPDEAFTVSTGDPTDPAAVAMAARMSGAGVYAALRAGGVLLLPVTDLWFGGRMRAIQCPPTDPVSFAIMEARDVAEFPNVAGWSARDCARRALAEHRAWLRSAEVPRWWPDAARASLMGHDLARALSAARAALFAVSLEAGEPELAVTVAGLERLLAERAGVSRDLAAEAVGAYRAWRRGGGEPPSRLVGELDRAVRRLAAYEVESVL